MLVARKWGQCIPRARFLTVLAMESSADDTGVAIIDGTSKRILANVVMKQHAHHEVFRGIHPHVAIQWHQRNMPLALQDALEQAKMQIQDVDAFAFTRGPGMGGCLSVAATAAKNLAAALGKPIVGVHHMQAHALTPELTNPAEFRGFPFLTLLISGGHTMIVLAKSRQEFKILANSVDTAIGNAFDKAARLLKIPPDSQRGYGAALEAFCQTNLHIEEPSASSGYPFPPLAYSLPNRGQRDLFSFTGLVAAVQRIVESKVLNEAQRVVLARAFQDAAFSQLELRLEDSLRWCRENGITITSLVVSGGVASNARLRERLKSFLAQQGHCAGFLIFPPPEYCTDNAAMIAWAAMHRIEAGDFDDYTILSLAKWSLEDLSNVVL